MKVVAHPLIVAAALGLLGPAALADDEPENRRKPCATCGPDASRAPSPEEFARVEAAWREAVVQMDRGSDLGVR